MGIRRGRRVPTIDPNNSFFYGGILICVTFGFVAAAIAEAYQAGDRGWMWSFIAGDAALLVLYFWNVWCWVKFPHPEDEYDGAEPPIDSGQGHRQRRGPGSTS